MFIVQDLTHSYRHITNDVETAADIVLGITGDDRDYQYVNFVAGRMTFGDIFMSHGSGGTYSVQCVKEVD